MSNEIVVSSSLSFRRVAKSGKVTTRGALGAIMSGNTAERGELSLIAAHALIRGNTFAPVMAEIARVFAPSTLLKHGVYKVVDSFAFYDNATKTISHIDGNWSGTMARLYAASVVARCEALEESGKEIKGEKLLALHMAEAVVEHFKAKDIAKLQAMTAQPVTA